MKVITLLGGTALALTGWVALVSATALKGPSLNDNQVVQNEQLAQNERVAENDHGDRKGPNDEWYQGQRGRWNQESNVWHWQAAQGDQWYQGRRGHWYREHNGWQWRDSDAGR